MNAWSAKRKAIYLAAAIAILAVITIIPTLFFLHHKPTCSDGVQNGSETGVDCGGECQLLCSFEAVTPTILWSRAFKVTDSVYSAVAYIENPNINSEALASYVFKLYDANNVLIGSKENATFIPKNKVIAIFEPNIDTKSKVPARVTFEFSKPLEWRRNLDTQPNIDVTQKVLTGEANKPRIDAIVQNDGAGPADNIELVSIVYDDKENAIAASRTFVDRLEKGESSHVTFTWPQAFMTSSEICRVPGDGVVGSRAESLGVMLAIDRSGSMASEGTNPPQPLTDVKNAVTSFVRQLKGTDQVGVVSFADTATDPVDSALSRNYDAAASTTNAIHILSGSTQNTNIGDGIDKSYQQLFSPTQNLLTNRVIILLTDGVANRPEKAGDTNYPENYAKEKADAAKKAGAELFTIGLGNGVNQKFLTDIASAPDHYFAATSTQDLTGIYSKIAVKFCETGPSVVEIIPRVVPASW